MLRGERLILRPATRADLPLLESWENNAEAQGTFNLFGLEPTHRLEQGFQKSGFLGDEQGMLLVALYDGTVIGTMTYRQVHYGPNSGSIAYSIGIALHIAHRGQGYGADAQRLLADYLFATYPVQRVEASTDATNYAEQRALEKAGFTHEGTLRQAQWRDGFWHDLLLYSKLRGEE